MSKIDVLLGLQWGDEGKGKGVDVLTPKYDVVARFQGGPNAGHTLEFNGNKHILHIIPSGIFHEKCLNIIGSGVVIDPILFEKEIIGLTSLGVNPFNNLKISRRAHLILPFHPLLDAISEQSKGEQKIGSTLKGIGPAYKSKVGREGLRVGDIESACFRDKYFAAKNIYAEEIATVVEKYDLKAREEQFFKSIDTLLKFEQINSEYYVNNLCAEGRKILAEGAQGSLLDVDFGSYPFVTSSNTVCGGVCTGLGVAPNKVNEVIGIVKAYCTRVGSGPFPTELTEETGRHLREAGNEFGSTTGRPRRCGWLDMVALKYSVMLNGITKIILTKTDVLDSFEDIKICTSYEINGKQTCEFPYDFNADFRPVYQTLPGWNTTVRDARTKNELPKKLLDYIKFIEDFVHVPVAYVSVGPDREETIEI